MARVKKLSFADRTTKDLFADLKTLLDDDFYKAFKFGGASEPERVYELLHLISENYELHLQITSPSFREFVERTTGAALLVGAGVGTMSAVGATISCAEVVGGGAVKSVLVVLGDKALLAGVIAPSAGVGLAVGAAIGAFIGAASAFNRVRYRRRVRVPLAAKVYQYAGEYHMALQAA